MKRFWLFAMLAVALILGSAPAGAQSPPSGSYRDSCRNIKVSSGVLSAECLVPDAREYRRTSIELAKCTGRDIENNGGRLECWLSPAKPGSFTLDIRGSGEFTVDVLGVDVNKQPFKLSERRNGPGHLVFRHTAFPLRGIAIRADQSFEDFRTKFSVTCHYQWIFAKLTDGQILTLNATKYSNNPNSCDEKR